MNTNHKSELSEGDGDGTGEERIDWEYERGRKVNQLPFPWNLKLLKRLAGGGGVMEYSKRFLKGIWEKQLKFLSNIMLAKIFT